MSELTKCRVCRNGNFYEILDLGVQPLSGVFPAVGEPESTSGPLKLKRCNDCGLVQLGHSYPLDEMYGDTYGYRSGLNKTMTDHLGRVARGLIRSLSLDSKDLVVDIGSNDGTFLNNFSSKGIKCVGIDPTSAKYSEFFDKEIVVCNDFFSEGVFANLGLKKAKLVTSIAMFYDLEDPIKFARDVNAVLEEGGYWFLEQSYAPWMRKSGAYDTICHEHLEYYSLSDLQNIMREAGFTIVKATTNDINGGSFGILVRKKSGTISMNVDPYVKWLQTQEEKEAGIESWKLLASTVIERRYSLRTLIEDLKEDGNSISALGASTKGNVLLNFTGLTSAHIDSVGEVNPYKFGRFTPGSHIPIESDEKVLLSNPDYLIFLPWHFRESALRNYDAFLTSGGRMIFPLPNVEVIGY